MLKKLWIIIAIINIFFLSAYENANHKIINISRPINKQQSIQINIMAGVVTIHGWEKDYLQVNGSIEKNVTDLIVIEKNNNIEIKNIIDKKFLNLQKHIKSDLEIYVPASNPLSVDTVNADILINAVKDSVSINTFAGSINLDADLETIDIRTIIGDVNINGRSRFLKGMSISGNYKISGDYSFLEIKTTSGDIEFGNGELKVVNLYTTSGKIKIFKEKLANSHFKISCVRGDVLMEVPGNEMVEFYIKSINGEISYNKAIFNEIKQIGKKLELIKIAPDMGKSIVFIDTISGFITLTNTD